MYEFMITQYEAAENYAKLCGMDIEIEIEDNGEFEYEEYIKASFIAGYKYSQRTEKEFAYLMPAAPALLAACIEAEKHHQGGHSDIGFILRDAIRRATCVCNE